MATRGHTAEGDEITPDPRTLTFDRQVAKFQVRVVVLNGFTALCTPITGVAG